MIMKPNVFVGVKVYKKKVKNLYRYKFLNKILIK